MAPPTPLFAHARRHAGWVALSAAGIAGLALSACSSTPAAPPRATGTTDAPASTTTSAPTPPASTCPLTGTPVPGGGAVPNRPALAVKIDNYPDARPQSGLDKADVVFEEPVEGGITRYAVVFQCQDAALVGPVRSARNIDIGILGQLGNPLEVHVGGIGPVLANISASPIVNVDLISLGSVESHPAGRYAPYDTYSTTSLLWGTHPTMQTPPAPLYTYSTTPPHGKPATTIHIPFSSTSDVTWKYNPTFGVYGRYYNGSSPDNLADGQQNSASTVIVQFVAISYGPWLENAEGGLEVQADLYPDVTGFAEVFRNGTEIGAYWKRSTLGSPTQYVTAAGAVIPMEPGRTWVEFVPDTITVTSG
jgi:hypothetical protein